MTGRLGVIGAIVRKDLVAFSRDRFYVLITVLGLAAYVTVYWFLPGTVDETIEVGYYWPASTPQLVPPGSDEGLRLIAFSSAAALQAAVEGTGEPRVPVGLEFPPDFAVAVRSGRATTVRVLLTADVPAEYRPAMTGLVRELAYTIAGDAPPISQPATSVIVLGQDRAGDQVSLRERMGPMFVFFALLIETFALATLVAVEIQTRTVTAILATPARVSDFLAAKALIGTALAFAEAIVLVTLIGALGSGPLVLVITLLLGALLVTGFGLIAGSSGKDFIGIVFWSMLFMIPLAIPSFAVLFPGSAAAWVKLLPSYGLVDTIVAVTAYGDGLGDVVGSLLMLAAWCAIAFAGGLVALRRKMASL